MPSELFDAMANSDQQTFKNVWSDIETTSQQQLLTDSSTAFSQRYNIRSVASMIDLGQIITDSSTVAAAKYRGWELNPGNDVCDGKVKSNLMGQSCDELKLYLPAVITTPVVVKVLTASGSELFSYSITVADSVVGWNTIPVNIVFPLEILYFIYDATEVASWELAISEQTSTSWCNALCGSGCCSDKCMGTIRGIETANLSGIGTPTYGTDAFGLTASISLTCSYERILCQNKKSFARALWYLMGHHTMFHAIYTPSFIRANTVDLEKSHQLKDEFFQRYKEELKRVIGGIKLNVNDICLECGGTYRKGWMS
jgi:hypothetical protein